MLAGLFRILGIHLNVAYGLDLTVLVLESALLWWVGRRFLADLECAAGLALFWLVFGFRPGLFSWALPNSFAMTFGATGATAVVALLIADRERPATGRLVGASLAAAAAGLGKLEFGAAAALTLLCHTVVGPHPGRRRLGMAVALLVPGLLLALAVAAVFTAIVPWRVLVSDNVYRVRSLARSVPALTAHATRPVGPLLGNAVAHYGILAGLAAIVATGFRLAARRDGPHAAGVLLAVAGLAVALWIPSPADFGMDHPLDVHFAWTAVVWPMVGAAAVVAATRTGAPAAAALVLVAAFSVFATLRWKLRVVWASYYGVFAPFLVLLLVRLPVSRVAGLRRASLAVSLVMLCALVHPALDMRRVYSSYTTALDYPRGRLWTTPAIGEPLAAVIDYLRVSTPSNAWVAVVPEERIINFLSERRYPGRDPGVGPGWLATSADLAAFIQDLEVTRTDTVVLSSRVYSEFGAGAISQYNPRLVDWVRLHFAPVLQAGGYTVFRRTAP